ncbi:MAG: hypothetical protein KC442_01225 [Thermomicrobiales bacterium]|nr:hypothetical protein [Thermomicrobiales bacterium]
MRRPNFRAILALCAFVACLGFAPAVTHAQTGTPIPASPDHPAEFCSPDEINAAIAGITESPQQDVLVSPASAPGMDLYLVKVTLEPGTCVSYASHFLHDGAAIWLVESGTIEFDFQLIVGRPVPDLALQRADGSQKPVTELMQLEAGDWVAADRAVHYSYRNSGAEPAVVIMTVLENRWVYTGAEFSPIKSLTEDCRGSCRNSRR